MEPTIFSSTWGANIKNLLNSQRWRPLNKRHLYADERKKEPKALRFADGAIAAVLSRLTGWTSGETEQRAVQPRWICRTRSQIGFKNLICCSQKWYSYRSAKPLIFKYAFRQTVVVSFKLKLRALNGEKVFKIRKCHLLCKGPFFA